VRVVLERAAKSGDAEAQAAITEVARRGSASPVVHAIVFRLAQELNDRMHCDFDRHFPKARVVPMERR
jgi:sirohydrochlorin ferrochelatase